MESCVYSFQYIKENAIFFCLSLFTGLFLQQPEVPPEEAS